MFVSRTFQLRDRILHLPLWNSDRMYYVKITDAAGKQFGEFYMAITPENPGFWCPLYLDALEGDEVTLSTEDEDAPEGLFDAVDAAAVDVFLSAAGDGDVLRSPVRSHVQRHAVKGYG